MRSGWQEGEGSSPDIPRSSSPHQPQEYVYGSSDEEDEEGEGAQGELRVSGTVYSGTASWLRGGLC